MHSIQNQLLQLLQHNSRRLCQACHSLVCDMCIPCRAKLEVAAPTLQLVISMTKILQPTLDCCTAAELLLFMRLHSHEMPPCRPAGFDRTTNITMQITYIKHATSTRNVQTAMLQRVSQLLTCSCDGTSCCKNSHAPSPVQL